MKKASVSELKNSLSAYLRQVRAGESVLVTDRGRPVARLEPIGGQAPGDAGLARMAAEEIKTITKKPLPPDFFDRPLPKSKKSVVEALLEEREEDRKDGYR